MNWILSRPMAVAMGMAAVLAVGTAQQSALQGRLESLEARLGD